MNLILKNFLRINKLLYFFILSNIIICKDSDNWLIQFKDIFNSNLIFIDLKYELKSDFDIFQSIPKTKAEIFFNPKENKFKLETSEMVFISYLNRWKNLNKTTNQMIIDNHSDSTMIKFFKYFNYNYLQTLDVTKMNNRKFLLQIDDYDIIVKLSKKSNQIDKIVFDMEVVKYIFYDITFKTLYNIKLDPFTINTDKSEVFDLRE
jgi:hypothetical protein